MLTQTNPYPARQPLPHSLWPQRSRSVRDFPGLIPPLFFFLPSISQSEVEGGSRAMRALRGAPVPRPLCPRRPRPQPASHRRRHAIRTAAALGAARGSGRGGWRNPEPCRDRSWALRALGSSSSDDAQGQFVRARIRLRSRGVSDKSDDSAPNAAAPASRNDDGGCEAPQSTRRTLSLEFTCDKCGE